MASQVLHRVLEGDAWAAPLLASRLREAELGARDAALATEIVLGTLRSLRRIDAALAPFLKRPENLDGFVRSALRGAAYQLRFLTRVPRYAVVNETVSIVRGARGGKLAGLTNAVLRRVADAAESAEGSLPSGVLPTGLDLPDWIDALLRDALDARRFEAFQTLRRLPPPLGLRARRARQAVLGRLQSWATEAERAHFEARFGEAAASALLVRHGGDPTRFPGYREGDFVLQEQGSQALVEALPIEAGARILDACAGRGGKSLAILDRDAGVQVTATDRFEEKLHVLTAEARRLGGLRERLRSYPLDLSVGVGELKEASFDGVLLDAPCTGLGTVHRRPELLLRLCPARLQEAATMQLALLAQVAPLVRRGGFLAYAVCSPSRQEGIEVAEAFEEHHAGWRREATPACDPDRLLRVGPWNDECDAYQLLVWRRAAEH